jgi:hypothetical protein
LTKVVSYSNLSDDCNSVQFSLKHGLSITNGRFREKN